eukprot:4145834-Prymnesium_polylepis.1
MGRSWQSRSSGGGEMEYPVGRRWRGKSVQSKACQPGGGRGLAEGLAAGLCFFLTGDPVGDG